MPFVPSNHQKLAVLGGHPSFPHNDPVPLIHPMGYRPRGDFSAVDAILGNVKNCDSKNRASQQRFVAKILPGVGGPGPNFRAMLQDRVGEFLELDAQETSEFSLCTVSDHVQQDSSWCKIPRD